MFNQKSTAGKRESDDASSNESLHGSDRGSDNEMPFLSRHSVQLGRTTTRKGLPTDGEEPVAAPTEEGGASCVFVCTASALKDDQTGSTEGQDPVAAPTEEGGASLSSVAASLLSKLDTKISPDGEPVAAPTEEGGGCETFGLQPADKESCSSLGLMDGS